MHRWKATYYPRFDRVKSAAFVICMATLVSVAGCGPKIKDYNDPEAVVPDYLPSGGAPESSSESSTSQPSGNEEAATDGGPTTDSTVAPAKTRRPNEAQQPTRSMEFD